MLGKQSKTTISRNFRSTVLRFCNTDVRKTKQNNDIENAFSRSPCVLIGSKHENTRSPYVFIGFNNKIPVGTRDDIRQTHPNPWRPFRARVGQIYEIRRPFRARVVKIVEMNARQALTFSTVSRPKCATVLRFCNTDVRKIYENRRRFRARVAQIYENRRRFRTRVAQIQEIRQRFRTRVAQIYENRRRFRARVAQIYKMKTREALTFLTVRKMKKREALTFLTVFNQKWRFRARVVQFWTKRPRNHADAGVVNLCATLATEISSVSRSHTASHRTHERNETISRWGVD